MAIALRGSAGTAATGTTSATPGFSAATAAGNLLVCWASSSGTVSISGVSGWLTVFPSGFGNVFYKPNCGAGETAPTVNGSTFTAGALAEFTGAATNSPLVDSNSVGGVTSPQVPTNTQRVQQTGGLAVGISGLNYTMAATKTTSHTYNNGTAVNPASWNNDATSTADHFRFSYALLTSNASADTLSAAFTTTNLGTVHGFYLAVFEPPQIAPTYPYLNMSQRVPA